MRTQNPALKRDVLIHFDLHDELAALLNNISEVSTAIRFQGQHWQLPHSSSDVVWLADSLHKLCHLGEVVQRRDREGIVSACDWLIADYENYKSSGDSSDAFKRQRLNLDSVIQIFRAIKAKVQ